MLTSTSDRLAARIRAERAAVAKVGRALRDARGVRADHEVAALERELVNRRAYLDQLLALARRQRASTGGQAGDTPAAWADTGGDPSSALSE